MAHSAYFVYNLAKSRALWNEKNGTNWVLTLCQAVTYLILTWVHVSISIQWQNGSLEQLSDLPKVAQLVIDKTDQDLDPRWYDSTTPVLNHYLHFSAS